MYSLMIVDDEPIVLKAISHVVETCCPQVKIVARTGSGLEAVSLALQQKPDIILLDIELTGINGLEAAAEIRKTLPETMIVIISAYDNFHYAKQSMALGAIDYLLKPVSKDDITTVLTKITQRLEEQFDQTKTQLQLKEKLSKIRPFLEEDLFFALLYPGVGMHPLQDYPHLLELRFAFGQAIEIYLPDSNGITENIDRYRQWLKNRISDVETILFGPFIGRTSLILLGWDAVPSRTRGRWENIHQSFRERWNISPSIIVGAVYPGFEGMIRSFRELRRTAWQASYRPGVYNVDEMGEPSATEMSIPDAMEQSFFDAVKFGHSELAGLIFHELHQVVVAVYQDNLQFMKDYYRGVIAVMQRIFYENAPESFRQLWDGRQVLRQIDRIDAPEEICPILDPMIEKWSDLIGNGGATEKNPEIGRVIEFMKQNYQKEISLTDIASAVALSPGYLTKLFKESRDQTVMDFLERIRMEQALKLLNETHLSIKEIAGQVGYKDPNYFSKVFKKVTNASPTEIRKV